MKNGYAGLAKRHSVHLLDVAELGREVWKELSQTTMALFVLSVALFHHLHFERLLGYLVFLGQLYKPWTDLSSFVYVATTDGVLRRS